MVHEIIKQQLGNLTLAMLGASNLAYDSRNPNFLSFRIKGSKKVNYIKITLNGKDLYDMEFGKIHGMNYKVVAVENDVYVDMLHSMIESNTGLYTKF